MIDDRTIDITLDGQVLQGRPGQTILELALENGREIPNLCHDPRLQPAGACRLCLVRVEGDRGLQPACTRKIQAGMVVETNTDEIRAIRKTILELLLHEHQGVCTTCDANGKCKLQRYAYDYRVDEAVFLRADLRKHTDNYTRDNRGIVYDPHKCIRCGRCIRICAEVQMDHALTFRGRAMGVEVTTAFDMPLHESTCELCGQCISTCPTDALSERSARSRGQMKDLARTRTTCTYCGVGCQIDLRVDPKANQIVKATSETGVVPNNGNLCVKGKFSFEFVGHPDRLKTPLIKRDGKFEPISWDQAILTIAERFAQIKRESGPDALAGLSSAKCTNEDNYVFQKFVRAALGTNNVDHCARLCHASTVSGLAKSFGSGAMTNSIDDLRNAKCFFVIGSNTTEAHPVIALAIKEAAAKHGATLIVADPRQIDLTRFAQLHLRHLPGTDVALVNAMLHVIIRENLLNRAFIDERTENFEQMAEVVQAWTPEIAAKITSVPPELIRTAARTFAQSPASCIVYSMGITQHTTGTDNVLSLANLAMLTGQIGRPGTGVNPLRGQNNVQGACDMGALPNMLPGYQTVDNPENRAKFEKAWNVRLPERPGLTVVELMHAAQAGKIWGMYIMGENPALSDPNLNRARNALDSVEFLVVQDIFLTETARYADVVLPACCYAEKDGTFTNTERRVQRVRKAVEPPPGARNDWDILCAVSSALGYRQHYADAGKIMEEIATLTPIYGGIAYDRLEAVGLQWPCPEKNHPGTPILHTQAFTRGKGRFYAVNFLPAAELPSSDFPLVLSTGRILYQYHTGTMTRKSPVIEQVSAEGYVEIHFDDATSCGIHDGDCVQVSTSRGKVVTRARVTDQIAPGCLFMPFHFHEGPANLLTNDALDATARIPEFKVCAAAIAKVR